MVLEVAIVNLTKNLDFIIKQDGKGISSHSKLKVKALECLSSLVAQAPVLEFDKLIGTKNHEILLGYLLNVLCQLAKSDKSRVIRQHALEIVFNLTERLEEVHCNSAPGCSTSLTYDALPGVSSTLFRLIMSDTKLPKKLFVVAISTLKRFINLAFASCDHRPRPTDLEETCENFAVRFSFLINYITSRKKDLPAEIFKEMLDLCITIVNETRQELLSSCLSSLVRYMAFMSSQYFEQRNAELDLKLMLMSDGIKVKISNSDESCDSLENLILKNLVDLLTSLEEHSFTMLAGERLSQLSLLYGYLKLMPAESLSAFIELEDKRTQIISLFTKLAEYNTQQPFLLLTETTIDEKALENSEKIYTIEKRFAHIEALEAQIISECCGLIGRDVNLFLVCDVLLSELGEPFHPSHQFIRHEIFKGLANRSRNDSDHVSKCCSQLLMSLIDRVRQTIESTEEPVPIEPSNVLASVIAIEMIVTSIELFLNSTESENARTFILRPLLCPLLLWSSAPSRAISEASLGGLFKISKLYRLDCIKSLIEANIDYIVDGASTMLNSFSTNVQVTNVLAIALKLSSIQTLYYFQDIYVKIFKLIGLYQHTEKSKYIALLFYRTLNILGEWQDSLAHEKNMLGPLDDVSVLKSIRADLDLDIRLVSLRDDERKSELMKERLKTMEENERERLKETLAELKDGKTNPFEAHEEATDEGDAESREKKKPKAPEIVLIETIMKHCIGLLSSNYDETKILVLRASACGLKLLSSDEDTMLPLVHKLWTPLVKRLTSDYGQNLEVNMCAFECLMAMASHSKDFIKRRTLDSVLPRICLFLESQARTSLNKKDFGPYSMTAAYKCQLKILENLGAIAHNIQLAYTSLWRIIEVAMVYLDSAQMDSLRRSAKRSLEYMIALDADCVWYFAKQANHLHDLPFDLVYEL